MLPKIAPNLIKPFAPEHSTFLKIRFFGGKFDVFGDFQHFWGSFTEIRCNVPIELPSLGSYTSDVVCITDCGEMFVREWVFRQRISIPMTIKLLDASREYWIRRGVKDWGIATDEEK